MKKVAFLVFVILLILGVWFLNQKQTFQFKTPKGTLNEIVPKPLLKYSVDSLSKTTFAGSEITFGQVLGDEPGYLSRVFYFYDQGKKVSGLANIPKSEGKFPIIVMFRGYVDREKYATGVGTQRTGEALAKAGFIILAPDFLGYGQSDDPSQNPLEERFQTYTTALALLSSIKNLNSALSKEKITARADFSEVGIWGHSNGGQIALTILEITGASYPTVLWAPVSKPFPYSVLYYTDDFDDHGKMLRRVIADFEKDYDVEDYSLTNFFERIKAPIELHQGQDDESVPQKWSDELNQKLIDQGIEIAYFTYPSEDHNFARGAWGLVTERNIDFFQKYLGI